jgi:hypothetical protein
LPPDLAAFWQARREGIPVQASGTAALPSP